MRLPQITLAVESRLECIPLAVSLVKSFCEAVGAPPSQAAQIEVCVAEAMNNAVVHAYRRASNQDVEVSACLSGSELIFEIRDRGIQMDPEILKHDRRHLLDLDPLMLDELPESGRGLAIIQSCMDSLVYSSAHGVNRLVMTMHLSKQVAV